MSERPEKRLRLIDDIAAEDDEEGEDLDYVGDEEEEGDDDDTGADLKDFIKADSDVDAENDAADGDAGGAAEEEKEDDSLSHLTEEESRIVLKARRKERRKREKERRRLAEESSHAAFDRQREEADVAQALERYGVDADNPEGDDDIVGDAYGYGDEERGTGPDASKALPKIDDPKLFLVKCDPGKEDEVVLQLMKRFVLKQDSKDERLFILSAFTTPASHGYVYIEAFKEVHVKKAIYGIRALKAWKVTLVPQNEMITALTFNDNISVVNLKQWVRIKGGVYRNDLGQVVDVKDHGTKLTVKLIPRIDLVAVEEKRQSQTRGVDNRGKRKRNAVRPEAKLFDREEIEKLAGAGSVERKAGNARADVIRNYWFYAGNKYKNGYLYKDFNINAVLTDAVHPQADELERFKERRRDDDDERKESNAHELTNRDIDREIEQTATKLSTSATLGKGNFAMNDRVIVVAGETANLTGRIALMNNDSVTVLIDGHHGLPAGMTLDFTFNQIRKWWVVGDHVKAVAGSHIGETGLITQVREADGTVTVFSDSTMKEMTVNAQDLIETSEVSSGKESLGQYQLHDLVQLAGDIVGVIVKIDVNSMKVLTHRGTITTAKLSDIVRKKHSRFAAALDYHGNQIVKGDMVSVLQGQYQGKSGTIQHLYRGAVFIHNRSFSENSGVIVVPAKHVANQAATMQAPAVRPQPGAGLQRGGFASRGRGGRGGRGGKFDPLFNKVVTVTGGAYKGYAGRVVVVDDNSVRVELSAITRTVQVPRNQVAERQATAAPTAASHVAYGVGSQTPLLGSRTPAYDAFASSRTPAYEFGGRTPAYSAAAASFGGATPSNVWSAQTPAHPYDSRDADEDDEELDLERQMMSISSQQASSASRYPSAAVPSKPEISLTPTLAAQSSAAASVPAIATTSVDSVAAEIEEDDEATTTYPESGRVASRKLGDKQGTIKSINADNSAVVTFDDKSTATVAYNDLQAVTPEKNDFVFIMSGANKRQHGQLVGINQDEAIVEVEGDIVIAPLVTLIKMAA